MAFGILVLKVLQGGNCLSCIQLANGEKDHRKIVLTLEKSQGFHEKKLVLTLPNQAGTLHPNPAPFPADSGHARCSFPFRNKGGAITCRELRDTPTTRPEGEWISGDVMQHSFLRFEMARRIRGWCRLVVLMYCLLCRLRQKRGHVHL